MNTIIQKKMRLELTFLHLEICPKGMRNLSSVHSQFFAKSSHEFLPAEKKNEVPCKLWYNKPFYKDVLGISYSEIHETGPRQNEARYNKNPRYDEQNSTCLVVYSFIDTPTWHRVFLAISDICSRHYKHVQDINFTVCSERWWKVAA